MNIEHEILPKELIELFDSLEYEENGFLEVNSFDFLEKDILFKFSLYFGEAELREFQLWQVKILDYKDFNINFNSINNYFEFKIDHIALKQYDQPLYELYFKSTANNPETLYVEIQKLHRDIFNNYISTQYLNTDLLKLCKAESGLFARGAKPILEYYFNCLQNAGKKTYFYKPNIKYEQNELINSKYKLMSLGSIYFIGTDFLFEKLK